MSTNTSTSTETRELLFEIGCEEIPARLIPGAERQLRELLGAGLEGAGLEHAELRSWSTPRRLAVAARVATQQPDVTRDLLGPPARVAWDADGNPTKAAEAFARRQGVAVEAIERRETPRGEYAGLTIDQPGQAATELLPELLVRCVSRLEWPKAMRWGTGREPWIRPLHWYVALFGGAVVPMRWGGVSSGATTRGHRFHAPQPFPVDGVDSWLAGLRARHVEPDPELRRQHIAAAVERLGAEVGGTGQVHPQLLIEVGGLVEYVVPMRGEFEAHYLEIPAQVLTTSMRKHQRYFPVWTAEGALSNHFVVICGTDPHDHDVVAAGHGRVLRARLADARFFYEQDKARTLESFVPALAGRRFLEGLGSMLDKAGRLERLAPRVAALIAPDDAEVATAAGRAALLAKADLASAMVGEFGDLQGEMGREYARLAGESEAVAGAIYEHYLPRFAADVLPDSAAGRAVALADRLDSLVGCYALGLEPTGSADPFALRRQALGVIRLLEVSRPAPSIGAALDLAREVYGDALPSSLDWPAVRAKLLTFFRGRLKAALAADFPSDLTEAVLAVGFEHPMEARGRLAALCALRETEGWADLAIAVKRVARIVAGGPDDAAAGLDPSDLQDPAERALFDALRGVECAARDAVAAHDYPAALACLITLRPTIDRFFDDVMVMSDDPSERARRLGLLAHIDALFHRIADFANVST